MRLTESDDGRLRVSELARLLGWERSRLSHHVTRMERRGLVARDDCVDDGRGAYVVLTPEGRRAIEDAAPHHVRTVRRLFVDELTPDEVAALTPVLERLGARVASGGAPTDPSAGAPAADRPRRFVHSSREPADITERSRYRGRFAPPTRVPGPLSPRELL